MNIQAEFLYITFEIIGPPYCKLRKRKNPAPKGVQLRDLRKQINF